MDMQMHLQSFLFFTSLATLASGFWENKPVLCFGYAPQKLKLKCETGIVNVKVRLIKHTLALEFCKIINRPWLD